MARKKQEEAPKGSPAWMATFSDLMNLLLCFFVLLFSMSSIDAAKFEKVVESFNQTFSVLNGGASAIGDGLLISNGVSQLNELDDYINSTGKMDEGQIVDEDVAAVQEKLVEREPPRTIGIMTLIARFFMYMMYLEKKKEIHDVQDQEMRRYLYQGILSDLRFST